MTRSQLKNSDLYTLTGRPDGATARTPSPSSRPYKTVSVSIEDTSHSQAQVDLVTPPSLGKVQTSIVRIERRESARRLAQAREEIRRRPPSPGPHDADYS